MWVLVPNKHKGIEGKNPGNRVLGLLCSGGGDKETTINNWGQLCDDILMMNQAQGNNVYVPDLLLNFGCWSLVESPGQVWDKDLLDNI